MTYMPEIEKKSNKKIIAQFRVTEKEAKWIDLIAKSEGCSKSEVLRTAFEWYKVKRAGGKANSS